MVSEEEDDKNKAMAEMEEGEMKVYGWMGRTRHLMTSGIMEK